MSKLEIQLLEVKQIKEDAIRLEKALIELLKREKEDAISKNKTTKA